MVLQQDVVVSAFDDQAAVLTAVETGSQADGLVLDGCVGMDGVDEGMSREIEVVVVRNNLDKRSMVDSRGVGLVGIVVVGTGVAGVGMGCGC